MKNDPEKRSEFSRLNDTKKYHSKVAEEIHQRDQLASDLLLQKEEHRKVIHDKMLSYDSMIKKEHGAKKSSKKEIEMDLLKQSQNPDFKRAQRLKLKEERLAQLDSEKLKPIVRNWPNKPQKDRPRTPIKPSKDFLKELRDERIEAGISLEQKEEGWKGDLKNKILSDEEKYR